MSQRSGQPMSCVLIVLFGVAAAWVSFSLLKERRSAPFSEPDDLVLIREGTEGEPMPAAYANVLAWRSRTDLFQQVSAFTVRNLSLDADDTAAEVRALVVSDSLFQTLGVQPWLGRVFIASEGDSKEPRGVILSHDFWQERFGGEPNAVGRPLVVAGAERWVIGIMPPGFRFPSPSDTVDLFLPLATPVAAVLPPDHELLAVARLRQGVGLAEAAAELGATDSAICDHPAFAVALTSFYFSQ